MPNSPSSMVNQYRLEDDVELLDTNIKDLLVTVDNPESHVTAIETFIVYRVVTKVRLIMLISYHCLYKPGTPSQCPVLYPHGITVLTF